MGVSPLRFRPALSRSIIVLPRRRRLVGCCPTVEVKGIARMETWSWRRASRLGWGRKYQMNAYEVVKVHGEGRYPFTYRGENRVLLGRFEKIFSFSLKLPKIPLKW